MTGYQFQSTVTGGLTASNFTAVQDVFGVTGVATAQGQYTDRPTVIYTPLTGVDFLDKLMTPIPPSAVLFVLQAGYPADVIMPIALDSINGIHNESKRGMMRHAGDPRFNRLVQLLRSLQLAQAVEVRIEHSKDGSQTSLITFTSNQDPQAKAESAEVRSLLGLRPDAQRYGASARVRSASGSSMAPSANWQN